MKKEKGSIAMMVFVTIMFILIILATLLTSISAKSKSQLVETQKLKDAYDGNMADIFQERNQEIGTSQNYLVENTMTNDAISNNTTINNTIGD